MVKEIGNEEARQNWLAEKLAAIPAGKSLLDVGAGECQYKKYCGHLNYVAQDVNLYDGSGDKAGLQTGTWDHSQIDIVCDLLDIPETEGFDVVLCSEVLEHVPDPARALEKLLRLTKPGRQLIVTAPFCSMTHFAPYHYATGFSAYFYKHHLERFGWDIVELSPNGGFFDYQGHQMNQTRGTHSANLGSRAGFWTRQVLRLASRTMRKLANADGSRNNRKSSELLTFGWHVVASRPLDANHL